LLTDLCNSQFYLAVIRRRQKGKPQRVVGVAGKCSSEKTVLRFAINSKLVVRRDRVPFQIHDLYYFFLGLRLEEKHGDPIISNVHG
jgi:hypothetical protein